MRTPIDAVSVPATWAELSQGLAHVLNVPVDDDLRSSVLEHAVLEFCHHISSRAGAKRRPWAVGCGAGPIYVAVTDETQDMGLVAARLFCFVRITFSGEAHTIDIPDRFRVPGQRYVVDVAIVRWMCAHPSTTERDTRNRPLCPGLTVNHALWIERYAERRGIRSANVRAQVAACGLNPSDWFERYQNASFGVIASERIAHVMNAARDPDTSGLLETLNFPGMQCVL